MALLELSFANTAKLKKEGRSFDCSTCPKAVKRLRRCEERREDFTSEDGAVFPIQIFKGGEMYGFCPGKVTRDYKVVDLYETLIITAETGTLMYPGCLLDQPEWYVDILGWFLPRYDQMKFTSKADMILGDMDSSKLKSVASQVKGRH